MSGGWSPVEPVIQKVKDFIIRMKPQIQQMARATFTTFIPVDYIFKEEGGVNYTYIVKVEVGAEACLVKVSEGSAGELNLQRTEYPVPIDDPPKPFN